MGRARVLLTVTDGCDNRDQKNRDFEQTISLLNEKEIFSLSCGIGTIDVDHKGLSKVASRTNGAHIAINSSIGIAEALRDLSVFLSTHILGISIQEPYIRGFMGMFSQETYRMAVDLIILIDCSWSMLGMKDDNDWSGDKNKLPYTKVACINVIRSLNSGFDRIGIARFWEKYQLLVSLTNDFGLCEKYIRGIEGGSGTGLYRAMAYATEEF